VVKNRLIAVGRGHERAAHRCSARVSVEIFLNEVWVLARILRARAFVWT